jgi:hypothetical protein
MNLLSSTIASAAPPVRDRKTTNGTLLLGTSPGARGIHRPDALPLDTVTYLLRAEVERSRLNAQGILHLIDKRIDGDESDRASVEKRTDRLRLLIHRLAPSFRIRMQSALEEDGFDHKLHQAPHPSITEITDDGRRAYTHLQTSAILHLREEEQRLGDEGPFRKFGWVLTKKEGGIAHGGEATFDAFLPSTVPLIHTAPGFLLSQAMGKAPYLLQESEVDDRILVPETIEDIPREIAKIKPGICRISAHTLLATCRILLREKEISHVMDPALVQLPVSRESKTRIDDIAFLDKAKQMTAAALATLAS